MSNTDVAMLLIYGAVCYGIYRLYKEWLKEQGNIPAVVFVAGAAIDDKEKEATE
jgi:hypothetical protein